MIRFRQKNNSKLGLLVGKAKLKALDAAVKVAKGAKKINNNPGTVVRKVAAKAQERPDVAAAAIADAGLTIAYPPYAAIPVGFKHAALTPAVSKHTMPLKLRNKLADRSKRMMSNDGKSTASKFGKGLEYYTNNALLGLSKLGPLPL